jgi:Bacterial toxin 24
MDLKGATHNGTPTPHVQRVVKNINPQTGQEFWNNDPNFIRQATKQDLDLISQTLNKL